MNGQIGWPTSHTDQTDESDDSSVDNTHPAISRATDKPPPPDTPVADVTIHIWVHYLVTCTQEIM